MADLKTRYLKLMEDVLGKDTPAYEAIQTLAGPVDPNEVLAGDPGGAPAMAMIPTAKNIGKFLKKVKDLYEDRQTLDAVLNTAKPTKEATNTMKAMALWEARHPMLSELFQPVTSSIDSSLLGGAGARYIPNEAAAADAPGLLNKIRGWMGLQKLKQVPTGKAVIGEELGSSMREVIDAIGHETTHGLQMRRNPMSFTLYPNMSQRLANEESIKGLIQTWRYMNHPTEVAARKGGALAASELDRINELVANTIRSGDTEVMKLANEMKPGIVNQILDAPMRAAGGSY